MKPPNPDASLECKSCGRRFVTAEGLLEHGMAKHGSRGAAYGQSHLKRNGLVLLTVLVIIFASYNLLSSNSSSQNVATGNTGGTNRGNAAPDFQISLVDGSNVILSHYRGSKVLLWFVTTWCSSCQQGAEMLASQYYSQLHSKGVIILVVELYNNLGQPGPSISQFANEFGAGTGKLGWSYGTAGQDATYTYDPKAYLDIWYLIDKQGTIIDLGVGLPDGLTRLVSEV